MLTENGGAPPAASGKRAAPPPDGVAAKRRRSDGPAAAFDKLLSQGGCQLSEGRDGFEFEAEDPRRLRRLLEQKLTLNSQLRGGFLEGLQEQLAEAAALHAALKPMAVTGHGSITGDSFVRVLLNVAPLQADVSRLLLERLPEFCDAEGEEAPLPQLILGQFRWLDHVSDPHFLTEELLKVLDVCPEQIKKDAITFLPEVATEDDHEAVIAKLDEMMGCDPAYILPSIEALANLCLTPDQQSRVVDLVLERFQQAEAEDLPALARFLLQHAAPGAELKKVVSSLRDQLRFVSPSDPRLAVPDRKQKGRVLGGTENPEYRMMEAAKQAMQLNPAVPDAVLKEVRSAAEPEAHRLLDFWLLLVMMTLGADRRKAAETLLRRKFAEGHAPQTWMQRAIAGHEAGMLEFFAQLLSLAQQLLRHAAEPVQAAGAQLYCLLFKHFTAAYNQQEVLRALHSHLGAQVAAETSAALQVLLTLSQQHTAALAGYAAFLTNILDYVDGYTDAQVHQVFAVFSELVAGACRQADEGGLSDGGSGRSRMEDELMIFVRKQLSSAAGQHRRVGIIGTVALVQRLGAATSDALEGESAIGKRYREAMGALKDTFDSCKRSPDAFGFLCDELSRSVQRNAIGRRLVDDVHGMLSAHLEDTFFCFLGEQQRLEPGDAAAQVGAHKLSSELWWNLDGSNTPVALKLLPLLAEELAPGSSSAPLLSLFSTIRLSAALEARKSGGLEAIEALLGCPLNLFEMVLADPRQFSGLAGEHRRAVLLGLWYALNWCRELANCFATQLQPDGSGDQELQLKLLARLRCCCQLEALLDALLPHAPPLFVLPPLGNTLDANPASMAAAALAAAPKKAGGKGGKAGQGGGKKKKGIKFAGEEDGSPAKSGRTGAASRSQQHTTSGGGSGTTQTHSGGTTQAGVAATQAVAVAAAGGLGRIAQERSKERTLLLPALATLGVGAAAAQEQPCYAALPSAAYVLADLHGKVKAVLAAQKRPSFLGRPAKQLLPADLADLSAAELLGALAPVLPAIRRHLDAACNVIDQSLEEEQCREHDRENFWGVVAQEGTQGLGQLMDACMVPMGNSVASSALSPVAAASRVRTLALDCVRQLLVWPGLTEAAQRPALDSLLAAFHKDAPLQLEGGGEDADLPSLVKNAWTYFAAAVPEHESDQPTTESPSHQHACLLILDALRSLLVQVEAVPSERTHKLLSRMRKRITRAAEGVLKQSWLDEKSQDLGSAAWKGRGPLLADVLRLHLAHRDDRVEAVGELAQAHLALVSDKVTGKEAAQWVEPYPSLSGGTIAVWYRACCEQLQAAWEEVVAAAAAAAAEKHTPLLHDPEVLGPLIEKMQACAAAFSALVTVVKKQQFRVQIHVQAVKSGGKFLETLFKALPFWTAVYRSKQNEFLAMVRDVQKGTRIVQTLCSEGKASKQLPLTAKVPMVKRTVEKFVFRIKAFMAEAGNVTFTLGQLKHRDLAGREIASQYYADSDGEEEDEEEGGGEEEDEEYEEHGDESQPNEDY
ncbi:Fanconi anemia group D2-like protein [Chlorella sorokiniana]|uniref:Fanconi anemia group D2-like protein n=1 Tax=Chlorella sorokiniana TaxID=3076 RepID=A0A2P6TK23_CHLSO|nr:Fanconi anemia group D2-like protein [Chlorella sorokiniana]|eukprot:PRW44427.1 Fanconi anemia group D2-like protein [Chlorella sorokiniana]